jgi:hypothetical protein
MDSQPDMTDHIRGPCKLPSNNPMDWLDLYAS